LSGNNGALGNKIFEEKKDMNKDGGRQGYLFSNLWINEYLKNISSWDIAEFDNRFSLLVERFKSIWKYPNVSIANENEEYIVLDAPEPRHKSLEYFSFRDELIITNEFSKMYSHVVSNLFNENPSKFLLSDLKETVTLTTDRNRLRSPYAINDTYFIESNIDSNGKFNRLKRVLHEFDMEDELTFKYEENIFE